MASKSEDLRHSTSADRGDDEKTIHGDSPVREFADKKDIEAGNTEPALVPESEQTQPVQTDASLDADDFPDGGLRAWLVVVGVSFHLGALSNQPSC